MITSPELVKLFLLHIFLKHKVLSCITSDRDSEFISHFFKSLDKVIDICLHFTSSYHLEEDRQTEKMNHMLEWYLWIYCHYNKKLI